MKTSRSKIIKSDTKSAQPQIFTINVKVDFMSLLTFLLLNKLFNSFVYIYLYFIAIVDTLISLASKKSLRVQ